MIIKVENLSKKYRISHQGKAFYATLSEEIINLFSKPVKWIKGHREKKEDIWAVKNINFSVEPGEILGIIGANGAGKSTLLKILSRITPPTEGRAIISGRVSSLLEVGVGFHPELTGRENIFLNGAILGMGKKEIIRKFNEIVDFAGIEKFLDTPVKRYSSGMYVRLAFSVAAHLEPEILLVDEVLAVGDAAFQKKSLGKMKDVAKSGRTVLFVSHNMGIIQQLTERCLLLENGSLVLDGSTPDVIEKYLKNTPSLSGESSSFKTELDDFYIASIKIDSEHLENGFNKPLRFDINVTTKKNIEDLFLGLLIINSVGSRIMTAKSIISKLDSGKNTVSLILENHYLPPGFYTLNVGIDLGGANIFYKENILSFEILSIGVEDSFMVDRRDTLGVCPPVKYEIKKII